MINKKISYTYIILIILIIIVFFLSLMIGSNEITILDTLKSLFGKSSDESISIIIKKIRLPRIFMAMISGAGLAAGGCVFQGILRNPLADPFTLGISGGAAFGTAIAFVLGLSAISYLFIPVLAFLGALISVFAVYFLSSKKRFDANSMILSGVVISYIFSSAVMLVFSLSSSHQAQAAFVWLMGNFSTFDERLLLIISIIVIIGTVFLSLCGNIINAIMLGNEKSQTLGINVERAVKIIFLAASFITASIVSLCGIIGFVGLMMPHIMRKIIGANNLFLIPASALAGAAFLPLCDMLSRTLFSPVIIPVGVITSIIGGVFFIFLLLRKDKGVFIS